MNTGLTLIQTDCTLDEYLRLRALERHTKAEHITYTSFPNIRDIQTTVYWGVFSWSIPKENVRWLKKNGIAPTVKLASTKGDIVRDYLGFYHPLRLRAIRAEAQTYELQPSAPLYINPTIIPKATYIDIDSAYYSIVKMVGWNVTYLAEKWLTPGRAPLDFPLPNDKTARNYLVSIGLKTPMVIWTGFQMVLRRVPNVHTNRALWLLVQDVLHSLANIAVACGAIYVHTDGCILPSRYTERYLTAVKSFGLSPRIVAEGTAYVCGFGNYQVGDKRTARFEPERVQHDFSNLRRTPERWLVSVLRSIRKRGTPERLFEQSMKR